MNRYFSMFLVLLLAIFGSSSGQSPNLTGTIRVEVNGFENNDGKARLLLFNTKQKKYFPSEHKYAQIRLIQDIRNGKATFNLTGIAYGDYAISVHHDENNDGEVNTNWVGLPKEGLGASNDATGSFGPPDFEDAMFTLKNPQIVVRINIVN